MPMNRVEALREQDDFTKSVARDIRTALGDPGFTYDQAPVSLAWWRRGRMSSNASLGSAKQQDLCEMYLHAVEIYRAHSMDAAARLNMVVALEQERQPAPEQLTRTKMTGAGRRYPQKQEAVTHSGSRGSDEL
jgi:hypothetical protein